MEEGKKHIDDLFREQLGSYRETPGDHVWSDLERRLAQKDDGGAAAPVRSYRWMGYVMLLAALVMLGYFSFDKLIGTAQRGSGAGETEVVSTAPSATAVQAPGTEPAAGQNNMAPAEEAKEEKDQQSTTAVQQETTSSGATHNTPAAAKPGRANAAAGYTPSSPSASYSAATGEPVTEQDEPVIAEPVTATAATNNSKPVAQTNTRKQHNIKVTTTTYDTETEPAKTTARTKANISEPAAENDRYAASSGSVMQRTQAGGSSSGASASASAARSATSGTASTTNRTAAATQAARNATAPQAIENNVAAKATGEAPNNKAAIAKKQTIAPATAVAPKANTVAENTPAPTATTEKGSQRTAAPAKNTAPASANTTATATATKTAVGNGQQTGTSVRNNTVATAAPTQKTTEPAAPTTADDNKTGKQITPAASATGTGNNKATKGEGDKPPAGNTRSGQLTQNNTKPGEESTTASGLSVSGKQLSSARANPAAPQKVKTEPLAQKDAVARKAEIKETPAKTDLAKKRTTGGGVEGKHERRKDREKKPSQFEGGLKAGYEFNFAFGNANKYVIAPYIQYYFTPDVSFVIQPALKFGKASVGNVTGSSSYYDVKSSSFNSSYTITPNVASVSTVNYKYEYTQVYDSVLLGYNVGDQQLWDIELPLLLRYNLVPEVAFFAGPTLTYAGRLLQVTEDRMMYSGLTKTITVNHGPYAAPDTTSPPPGPQPVPYSSVMTYNARPISEMEKDKYLNGVTKMFSLGYMAGFSFMLADRLMMDVQFQQRFVSNKKVPVQRFKDVYTQPYIRISLGYRLFGDKRKVFGEITE